MVLSLIIPAVAERESLVSDEVYHRVDDCIQEYHKSANLSDSKTKDLREKAFKGLNDREQIRVLAEWIFRKPIPHYQDMVSNVSWLLKTPESVNNDFTELRRLMAVETDSRHFFQLSTLAFTAEKYGYDFMADRARGLFMKGVAADLGQSTTDHPLQSISMNTFSRITQRLRDESQTFKEKVYPELAKMDLEARNLALAKWLKANWPGCENLEIPDNPENEKDPVDNKSMETREWLRKPPATEPPREDGDKVTLRYLLGGVAALLALAGVWFGLRRMKSGA